MSAASNATIYLSYFVPHKLHARVHIHAVTHPSSVTNRVNRNKKKTQTNEMKLRNKVRVYWGWIEQLQFFYFLQTCLLLNHFCYFFQIQCENELCRSNGNCMFEIQDNLHIRIILTFKLFLFKNEGWELFCVP